MNYRIGNIQLEIGSIIVFIQLFLLILLSGCATNQKFPSTAESPSKMSDNTYYIHMNGNDTNPGTQTLPWKTIQKCLNQVQPGDTCAIRGGTYNESLTLKTSGTQSSRITLINYNGGIVTIYSGASMTMRTGGRVHYYTFDGLRFISTYVPPGQGYYSIKLDDNVWDGYNNKDGGNNGFIIRNCYVEGAIKFYGHNNLVENCEFNGRNVWVNGVADAWGSSHDNIYRNNNIHDYTFRGIWTMQYTDNITIEGNTVHNNGGGGIDCDGAANPVTRCYIRNNIIHDMAGEGVGIWFENCFDCEAIGNTVYEVGIGVETINYGLTSDYGFTIIEEYRTTNTNLFISNNTIYNIRRDGILCLSAPGVTVINNTIRRTNYVETSYFAAITLAMNTDYFCHNWIIVGNSILQTQKAYWLESSTFGLRNIVIDRNVYDYKSSDIKYYWKTWTNHSTSSSASYNLLQMQRRGLELNSTTSDTSPPMYVPSLSFIVDDWNRSNELNEKYSRECHFLKIKCVPK